MNANELADALQETEPYYSTDYKLFDLAATMLRQQQNQIAELEIGLKNVWKVVENKQAEIDRAVELYTDKAIENEALKELLANEGIVVGHDYLNNCIATMRKAQEK